ncbi:MAG: hypothetical protein Q9222_004545 [Ikaeria aurantiellina]
MPAQPARPYLSSGQVLQTPPLSARLRNGVDEVYYLLGLYVTTLFSLRTLHSIHAIDTFGAQEAQASWAGVEAEEAVEAAMEEVDLVEGERLGGSMM